MGDEDLNDHTTVRTDVALATALERTAPLASAATLCRLEKRADRQVMWRLAEVRGEQFIASCAPPPTELILAFDATDDPVMVVRNRGFSTAITITIVFYRGTFSAAVSCWSATSVLVTSMEPSMPGPF